MQFHHVEGIPILSFLSNAYSKSKTKIGAVKPLFIGALWAYAIVFLPPDSVPNDLFFVYSSLYSSVSNIADIKDIEEDKLNNIQTIPVLLGEKKTYALSSVLASISMATHHTNMLTGTWTVGDTFIEVVSALVFAYASYKSLE